MRDRPEFSKKNILTIAVILILFPATLYLSSMADRNYYLTSLLFIVYAMIPFFVSFEKRRPEAKELVIIAVMCAIIVVSRAIFIWVPHFKPITGVIIICGIAFGPQVGFLCGSVSAFVSNFIFGQGPWTPWQMFAFGMAGFISGLLFKKSLLSLKKLNLSIYGVILVMLMVGPLLDTAALFIMASEVTKEVALTTYIAGLPVNAVHATATFLTLWLVSKPMLEQLDRIKKKYGILED